MARPGPQTQAKRRREQAKKEKRRAKEEKKALRKAEKEGLAVGDAPAEEEGELVDQEPSPEATTQD